MWNHLKKYITEAVTSKKNVKDLGLKNLFQIRGQFFFWVRFYACSPYYTYCRNADYDSFTIKTQWIVLSNLRLEDFSLGLGASGICSLVRLRISLFCFFISSFCFFTKQSSISIDLSRSTQLLWKNKRLVYFQSTNHHFFTIRDKSMDNIWHICQQYILAELASDWLTDNFY